MHERGMKALAFAFSTVSVSCSLTSYLCGRDLCDDFARLQVL